MCVKINQGAEVSHKKDVHHKNGTTKKLQTFGAAKHFMTRNSEGGYGSKIYTYIQSEYIVNITKMGFLETRVLAYGIMAPFIVPDFIDDYAIEV